MFLYSLKKISFKFKNYIITISLFNSKKINFSFNNLKTEENYKKEAIGFDTAGFNSFPFIIVIIEFEPRVIRFIIYSASSLD